jgi:hypothetical protein
MPVYQVNPGHASRYVTTPYQIVLVCAHRDFTPKAKVIKKAI